MLLAFSAPELGEPYSTLVKNAARQFWGMLAILILATRFILANFDAFLIQKNPTIEIPKLRLLVDHSQALVYFDERITD